MGGWVGGGFAYDHGLTMPQTPVFTALLLLYTTSCTRMFDVSGTRRTATKEQKTMFDVSAPRRVVVTSVHAQVTS